MSMKLSQEYDKNDSVDFLEEELFDENVIFDVGFYFEVYKNPIDGKYDEESSEGASVFLYIDQEITYGQFLDLFKDEASVKDDELRINIIPAEDELYEQERTFAKENLISKWFEK